MTEAAEQRLDTLGYRLHTPLTEREWRRMLFSSVANHPVQQHPELKTLEQIEKEHIQRVLEAIPDATYEEKAEVLGITKKTLWEKRIYFNIDPPN